MDEASRAAKAKAQAQEVTDRLVAIAKSMSDECTRGIDAVITDVINKAIDLYKQELADPLFDSVREDARVTYSAAIGKLIVCTCLENAAAFAVTLDCSLSEFTQHAMKHFETEQAAFEAGEEEEENTPAQGIDVN